MINITGASDGRVAPIIAEILEKVKGQSLIVVQGKTIGDGPFFFCCEKDIHTASGGGDAGTV